MDSFLTLGAKSEGKLWTLLIAVIKSERIGHS